MNARVRFYIRITAERYVKISPKSFLGDEAALDRALDEFEQSDVTTFSASPSDVGPGSIERTRAYFADRARKRSI